MAHNNNNNVVDPLAGKKTKAQSSRSWVSIVATGESEALDVDKYAIMHRVQIHARDLRILDPNLSYPSTILGRERAIVLNLEHIKAIITSEEVLLRDPSDEHVIPVVKELERRLPVGNEEHHGQGDGKENSNAHNDADAGEEDKSPFEFRALEVFLEAICSFLAARTTELETAAYPALDELTSKISSRNLDRVRKLKSAMTRLTARVQKVRDELEQLLDDDDDMADLYLSRKLFSASSAASSPNYYLTSPTIGSKISRASRASLATVRGDENDVEELEMDVLCNLVRVHNVACSVQRACGILMGREIVWLKENNLNDTALTLKCLGSSSGRLLGSSHYHHNLCSDVTTCPDGGCRLALGLGDNSILQLGPPSVTMDSLSGLDCSSLTYTYTNLPRANAYSSQLSHESRYSLGAAFSYKTASATSSQQKKTNPKKCKFMGCAKVVLISVRLVVEVNAARREEDKAGSKIGLIGPGFFCGLVSTTTDHSMFGVSTVFDCTDSIGFSWQLHHHLDKRQKLMIPMQVLVPPSMKCLSFSNTERPGRNNNGRNIFDFMIPEERVHGGGLISLLNGSLKQKLKS
ncbi:hypothetical protein Bca4012_067755 [Brassica carinata]